MNAIKQGAIRAFQQAMNAGQYAMPQNPPELLEGPGSLADLPQLLASKGMSRVLLVTGRGAKKRGHTKPFEDAAEEAGVTYVHFDQVSADPRISLIEQIVALYHTEKCEGFVALGGGSVMDAAKAAAARISLPHKTLAQMGGTLKVRKRIAFVAAVPTTAGTGSEATIAAVVTDDSGHKYAIQDPLAMMPHVAVLDPELLRALPAHLVASTGMDALTHAVEAYTNLYSPTYTDELAREAVQLIFENLPIAYSEPDNMDAKGNMLLASFKAGRAFSRAFVGYVHALAHPLGGLYHVPHGKANAIILPQVMESFGEAVHGSLAELADVVGLDGATDAEKARAFIDKIYEMNEAMDIPTTIPEIQLEDIPQMVEWALQEAIPWYPTPVLWDGLNFTKMYLQLKGE